MRVGDADRQLDDERSHVVPPLAVHARPAGRDRDQRMERTVGGLVAVHEERPQPLGQGGEHQIVHRAAQCGGGVVHPAEIEDDRE